MSEYVPLNKGGNSLNIEGTCYMNAPVITFDSENKQYKLINSKLKLKKK